MLVWHQLHGNREVWRGRGPAAAHHEDSVVEEVLAWWDAGEDNALLSLGGKATPDGVNPRGPLASYANVRDVCTLNILVKSGAFCVALVPIRPRRRGERRSLRTFPGVSLRPPLAFNTHRRASTPRVPVF